MRLFSSSPVLGAAGLLAWGCTVYDSELLPSNGELTGNGAESGSGHSGSSTGGNQASSAGAGSNTGGTFSNNTSGDTATGGADAAPEGGAGNEGGEPSVVMGGTGGSVAGGGKAGTGGSAGGKAGAAGSSGSGGTGGGTSVVGCADHPVPVDKTTWKATASSSSVGTGVETDGLYNPPEHMLDGSFSERWSSGKAQSGDEWIQIDFGVVVTLTDLTLNPGNDAGDYPRSYAVRISNKSEDFAAAVKASGTGMTGTTFVHFSTPVTGRYLTVRQTGLTGPWWTIAEVLVGCTD